MALSYVKLAANVNAPTNETELAHVFKNSHTLRFEDRYHHYIHPAALRGVTQLTIEGLRDAEIYFLAPLVGDTFYEDAYRHDSGVLNLVDCHNCIISGAFVNRRPYDPTSLQTQTGNAVNIARSNVKFVNTKFFSEARMPVSIHSGSIVEIEDSQIEGDYFELFNGASSMTVRRTEIIQAADYPDSHSMMWVGSSHRSAVDNTLYENGFSIFEKCRFKMKSGRALVSGNGSYETESDVEFRECEIVERDEAFGVASWHGNFNSIKVRTNGSFGDIPDEIVRVGPGVKGFGKFVDYYQGGGGKPGGKDEAAPIVVDGKSSKEISE